MKMKTGVFLLLLVACTPVSRNDPRLRLELPADFDSSAETLPVYRKAVARTKEPLRFGDYQVEEYRLGWNRSSERSSDVIPPYLADPVGVKAGSATRSNSFEFKLATGGEPRWLGRCRTSDRNEETSVRGVPVSGSGHKVLVCALAGLASSEEWKLTFEGDAVFRPFEGVAHGVEYGELTDGKTQYEIEMLNKFVTGAAVPSPLGYRFTSGDTTVAAIALVPDTTVRLSPSIDPREKSLIAAAMSAILLDNSD